MDPDRYQFDDFTVDPADRSLCRGGAPLELNNRYFDALTLLLRERGRLVTKDRFMDEVWRGVPVTDEALTQCIRTLRRLLGDDAGRPHLIETVPKHGYRFIGTTQIMETDPGAADRAAFAGDSWRRFLLVVAAATVGGGIAGVLGGLFYGLSVGVGPAMGATSALFVLLAINMIVGLVAGVGVGTGLAAAELIHGERWQWAMLGGALGGFVTGGAAKLVGLDAFALLLGQSPGDMTGAPEGLILGAAVGVATWAARHHALSLARSAAVGGLVAGAAGVTISLAGGTFLGGSLDFLLRRFPESRFRLDAIGALFGESGFGAISKAATSGIECLLFGACVVGAMFFVRPVSSGAPRRPTS
jgi:DNA-binding winged helix-turn-helix (wHTH) protein